MKVEDMTLPFPQPTQGQPKQDSPPLLLRGDVHDGDSLPVIDVEAAKDDDFEETIDVDDFMEALDLLEACLTQFDLITSNAKVVMPDQVELSISKLQRDVTQFITAYVVTK